MNFPIILAATAIPIVLGFIWYNPKFGFGSAWMRAANVDPEQAKKSNMAVVFGLTILFSFFLAVAMNSIVVHQAHVQGLLTQQADFKTEGSHSSQLYHDIMEYYGTSFRSFKHGLLHGTLAGIMIALPLIGVNALFEGRKFKYIAINAGYWIVSMALMGGLICAMA